ncbi:hypothetical protein J7384_18540 [Endozoicomonas sp. G2_1]|uniref:hypothetical protein n=1 Tax=Endozoicomonas sp. G2_1 TaxID=2821091 RepID=UPI001ADD24D3|nr:hypothetical protein [Endozoicomonas sp. G2_1]MBO9492367.1 hypothetical protein [Endozoicomonas sp. G2_1]
MSRLLELLKKFWPIGLLLLFFGGWLINIISEPLGASVLLVTIFIALPLMKYLALKVFILDKTGSIPWYGSSIFVLGLVVVTYLANVVVKNNKLLKVGLRKLG